MGIQVIDLHLILMLQVYDQTFHLMNKQCVLTALLCLDPKGDVISKAWICWLYILYYNAGSGGYMQLKQLPPMHKGFPSLCIVVVG